MKVYYSPDILPFKSVALLGTFDGIHKGHRTLAEKAVEISRDSDLKIVLYTFDVNPVNSKMRLMSDAMRIEISKQAEIDCIYIEKFDEQFKRTSPEDFINNILIKRLNAGAVVVGSNFRFGYNHAGTPEMLKNYGFDVYILPELTMNGQVVSSSIIRRLIEEGNVKSASEMLGYFYRLSGEVVHGRGEGRLFGVRTANVDVDRAFVLPADGVYVTIVYIDDKPYKSVTNVGLKPTFSLSERTVETHIPLFDGDLYGKMVTVEFVDYIRAEFPFSSVEKLAEQIDKDIKRMHEVLRGEVFG